VDDLHREHSTKSPRLVNYKFANNTRPHVESLVCHKAGTVP